MHVFLCKYFAKKKWQTTTDQTAYVFSWPLWKYRKSYCTTVGVGNDIGSRIIVRKMFGFYLQFFFGMGNAWQASCPVHGQVLFFYLSWCSNFRIRILYSTSIGSYWLLTIFVDNSLSTRDKIAEFANSVDLDEVAHNEPPHLDLLCLPSSLWIINII